MNSLNRFLRAMPWKWYLISVVVIILDQITKYLAESLLVENQPHAVMPFFNLTLRYNTGAAFSLFADGSGWQRWFLGILAAVVSVVIVVWIARLKQKNARLEMFALCLVLGGALGNLIDRVILGHVIDFIEVYYREYYWPAFNIADSAISVGACLLVYDAFFGKKKEENQKSHSANA